MITFKAPHGYDLNIGGKPSLETIELQKPQCVGMLPEKIPFIAPRLHVQEGDSVKIGSVLFEDKRHPNIKFLSPGAGKVSRIQYGPRRVIQEIGIDLAETEDYIDFETISENELPSIGRDALTQRLTDGGVWQYLRELPFRHIPDPDFTPPAMIVSLDAKEPFQPQSQVYLKNQINLFEFGIRILKKLAPKVIITVSQNSAFVLKEYFLKKSDECITHIYDGQYPADDPGVLLYHTKTSSDDNHAWYISGQDVLMMAQALQSGRYPIERTVVLAGSSAPNPGHYQTRIGIPVQFLFQDREISEDARIIAGGIFRGYAVLKESFLGFYETSVTAIPEGNQKEFLGFVRPGYDKPSFSRAFLSVFNKSPMPMTGNLHGDKRACVACNHCIYVCPVNMLPQLTFKCVLADEIEEALSHGLLDCVECGLCTYVCPSKIEVCSILKDAKKSYFAEQNRMKKS